MLLFLIESNLDETAFGVPKLVQLHAELVHDGQVQVTHFALGLVHVIEDSACFDLAAGTSQHDNRQVGGIVTAGEHT